MDSPPTWTDVLAKISQKMVYYNRWPSQDRRDSSKTKRKQTRRPAMPQTRCDLASLAGIHLGHTRDCLYDNSVFLNIAQLLTHLDPLALLNGPVPASASLIVRPASIERFPTAERSLKY